MQFKESLRSTKVQLFDVYDRLRREELKQSIAEVEEAHMGKQYCEAWRIVNEVSAKMRAIARPRCYC